MSLSLSTIVVVMIKILYFGRTQPAHKLRRLKVNLKDSLLNIGSTFSNGWMDAGSIIRVGPSELYENDTSL